MNSTRAYSGVRALVLGGSGFIGRWVTSQLVRAGAEVHVAARNRAGFQSSARVHAADLCRPGEVAAWLREVRPAITFNLAGYGVDPAERDEARAWETNEGLVVALADELSQSAVSESWSGRALIHVGSALEYGAAKGDLSEETPCLPTTLYGRTKLAGTLHLASISTTTLLPAATARLFTVYGPGEHESRLLPTLVAAARSGKDVPLSPGLQRRDFAYVEDVAEGLLRLGLTRGPSGEIVNLATGTLISVRDFALVAARVLGIPGERLRFGALPVRAEEMEHEPVNIERLRALARWAPEADVERGIRRALESGIS